MLGVFHAAFSAASKLLLHLMKLLFCIYVTFLTSICEEGVSLVSSLKSPSGYLDPNAFCKLLKFGVSRHSLDHERYRHGASDAKRKRLRMGLSRQMQLGG